MAALTCVVLAGCSGAGPATGVTPDLVVKHVSVSDSDDGLAAGTKFTLSATVRNEGKAASAATTLSVYQSEDRAITADDTLVDTVRVPELAPSGKSSHVVSLDAPPTPREYYYGICLDAVADDSNTANDCSREVSVQVRESHTNSEGASEQSDPQPPRSEPSDNEPPSRVNPPQDDFPATTDTTGAVTVGGAVSGRITSAADEDWFAADLEAGQTYRIEARPETDGYLPILLGIYNADGVLVSDEPAPGASLGTLIHESETFYSLLFTAATDGRHYIAVGGVEYGVTTAFGAYRLTVAEAAPLPSDDYPATTATTGRVTVGGSMVGDFEWEGDED